MIILLWARVTGRWIRLWRLTIRGGFWSRDGTTRANEGRGKFVLTPIQKRESIGRRSYHLTYKVRDLGIFNRDYDGVGFDRRGDLLVSSGYNSFIWSKRDGWHQINGTYGWFVGATAINNQGEVTGSM